MKQGGRNYELDFFKLMFAIIIFFYHMRIFLSKNDPARTASNHLGTYCVHFFFIVSGMLMANSISKQNITENFGKASIDFVMRKFKGLFGKILLALCFVLLVDVFIYVGSGAPKGISGIGEILVETVSELLMIKMSGVYIENNLVTWYISAMLLCMLLLAYMLYKKTDFTLYVFAPLAAVFLLGYMCQADGKFTFFDLSGAYGFFLGGIYRAFCGLCFGICAYTMYKKINRIEFNKRKRILLTILEMLLYALYFYVICFSGWGNRSYMSVSLLLPIALAITFSGKSYVGALFRFNWMRCFAPLSLLIYLNQVAWRPAHLCHITSREKDIHFAWRYPPQ